MADGHFREVKVDTLDKVIEVLRHEDVLQVKM